MNTAPRRFLPTDPGPDLARALIRAATAKAICEITWSAKRRSAEQILEAMFPGDNAAAAVLRAATAPMSTSTAGSLQPNVAGAFVSGLQPLSGAARLIGRGVRVSLEGAATVTIPRVTSNAALGFAAEGDPIPTFVRALTAGTIADAGGGSELLIVTNPRQAVTLKLMAGPGFDTPVIGAPAVPVGTVIAIDPGGFGSAVNEQPLLEAGHEATIVLDDAPVPPQIGVAGSPNVVAAPTRSLWQVDSYGLRLTLKVAWAMRAPVVSWCQAVTW